MNLRIISYVMGRLVYAITIAMLIPFFCALVWHEPMIPFIISLTASTAVAGFFTNRGQLPEDKLSLREGIAIAGLTWLVASSIAAIPFMAGTDMSLIDCLFEGVAGITGTGGTVISDMDALPDSLLLWRSMSNWLGGLGIVVIFIALFPQPGSGSMHMFFAETTGPTSDRIMPRIKSTAGALLIMYAALTILFTGLLMLSGMNGFEALNHSMAGISTGGESTENGSIADYENIYVDITLILCMLIGGANFGLLFVACRKGLSAFWHNTEFRVYIGLFLVISLLIVADLMISQNMNWEDALRYASFQTASAITTTWFTNTDFNQWPPFSKLCLIILMFTGGCAGSTSGGIKLSRTIMLFKMIYTFILQKLHPRSIIHVKLNDKEIPESVVLRVARFFFLYMVLTLILGVIVVREGTMPVAEAICIGISMMGNAGTIFGTNISSFADMTAFSKLSCCFFMIMGRLEIFTLLAMLQPEFWRKGSW